MAPHKTTRSALECGRTNQAPSATAAVSCGIHDGAAVLDLDYAEDSSAGARGIPEDRTVRDAHDLEARSIVIKTAA